MKKKDRIAFRDKAMKAQIFDMCTCGGCGRPFEKVYYNQVFCKNETGTKCKDAYWNNVTETKRNNVTRISPANRAWKESRSANYGDHPFSSDALGQW